MGPRKVTVLAQAPTGRSPASRQLLQHMDEPTCGHTGNWASVGVARYPLGVDFLHCLPWNASPAWVSAISICLTRGAGYTTNFLVYYCQSPIDLHQLDLAQVMSPALFTNRLSVITHKYILYCHTYCTYYIRAYSQYLHTSVCGLIRVSLVLVLY